MLQVLKTQLTRVGKQVGFVLHPKGGELVSFQNQSLFAIFKTKLKTLQVFLETQVMKNVCSGKSKLTIQIVKSTVCKRAWIENSNTNFYTGSASMPTSSVLLVPGSKCTIMVKVFTTRLL